jgi:hypothetical protein
MNFTEKQLIDLGFIKEIDDDEFEDFIKRNQHIRLSICGNLVEITLQKKEFITVPNCDTLGKLENLIELFGL